MLLTILVDSAGGGSSRLGGVFQRGLRIFRQILHGERHPGPGAGPEQSLARLPQNQLSRVVPPKVSGNVFAVVRQGARGILSNYLARNQIHNLAAEMRRRYAVRLMSGSARFYTGLSNRVAIYSFVGISFGGFVHNQAYQGQRNGCDPVEDVIQDLFTKKPEEEPSSISENVAAEEETKLLVVRRLSLSEESDISILSEEEAFEDDFEVIQESELCLSTGPKAEDILLSDVETELREVIDLQTQQNADLRSLVQKFCEENALLKKTIHFQRLEEISLKRELHEAVKTVNAQQKELLMLRESILNEKERLKTALSQREATQTRSIRGKGFGLNPGFSRTSKDTEHAYRGTGHTDGIVNSELDMERLRAEGGRVRGLKVHRKKRMKNV